MIRQCGAVLTAHRRHSRGEPSPRDARAWVGQVVVNHRTLRAGLLYQSEPARPSPRTWQKLLVPASRAKLSHSLSTGKLILCQAGPWGIDLWAFIWPANLLPWVRLTNWEPNPRRGMCLARHLAVPGGGFYPHPAICTPTFALNGRRWGLTGG